MEGNEGCVTERTSGIESRWGVGVPAEGNLPATHTQRPAEVQTLGPACSATVKKGQAPAHGVHVLSDQEETSKKCVPEGQDPRVTRKNKARQGVEMIGGRRGTDCPRRRRLRRKREEMGEGGTQMSGTRDTGLGRTERDRVPGGGQGRGARGSTGEPRGNLKQVEVTLGFSFLKDG